MSGELLDNNPKDKAISHSETVSPDCAQKLIDKVAEGEPIDFHTGGGDIEIETGENIPPQFEGEVDIP